VGPRARVVGRSPLGQARMLQVGPELIGCQPEKRKVDSSILSLTTERSALTCGNATLVALHMSRRVTAAARL
jgi:hypothetical protein